MATPTTVAATACLPLMLSKLVFFCFFLGSTHTHTESERETMNGEILAVRGF